MSNEPTQSLDLAQNKGFIINNKDILTKKINWDRYLKSFSYLFYSIFVSLLTLSFFFSGVNNLENWNISIDLISIFTGLFTLLFSIALISWIFKGTMKKMLILNYYFVHLINGFMLILISIVLSLPFASYDQSLLTDSIINFNILYMRSLIFAIGLLLWSIIGGLGLGINIYRIKGIFPIVWLKFKLSFISIFIFPIVALISYVAANPNFTSELRNTLLLVEIFVLIFGFLYISFVYFYIKNFKETLLSDKTEQEIKKIDNFRDISFLMILISSITLFVLGIYKFSPIFKNWDNGINTFSLIAIIIDWLVLIPYLVIIILAKNAKEKNRLKKLSSIDNALLIDLITWFLLVKSIIFVGFVQGVNISGFLVLSSCFLAIFIINISVILLGINFPNINNTVSTIVNIIASLVILGMALFQSTYKSTTSSNIFESSEIIILTLLPIVIASSINLGMKILDSIKINKNNNSNEYLENELNNNELNNIKVKNEEEK